MSLADKLDPAAAFCRAHPRLSIATALIIAVSAIVVMTTGGDDSEALKFHKVERGRFLVSVIEGGDLIYIAVPEPSPFILMLAGLVVLTIRRQHRPTAGCCR